MSKLIGDELLPTNHAVIRKTVSISAPRSKVWEILTKPSLMKEWMFPAEIEIITDWNIGSPISIRGNLHGVPFENKGVVLEFDPEKVLRYTHLSSVSRLPDEPASYSIVQFDLAAASAYQTNLTLTLSNFPTLVIYKHLAYYWNVTLELVKRRLEESA